MKKSDEICRIKSQKNKKRCDLQKQISPKMAFFYGKFMHGKIRRIFPCQIVSWFPFRTSTWGWLLPGLYLSEFHGFCADWKLGLQAHDPRKIRKIPISISRVEVVLKSGSRHILARKNPPDFPDVKFTIKKKCHFGMSCFHTLYFEYQRR